MSFIFLFFLTKVQIHDLHEAHNLNNKARAEEYFMFPVEHDLICFYMRRLCFSFNKMLC